MASLARAMDSVLKLVTLEPGLSWSTVSTESSLVGVENGSGVICFSTGGDKIVSLPLVLQDACDSWPQDDNCILACRCHCGGFSKIANSSSVLGSQLSKKSSEKTSCNSLEELGCWVGNGACSCVGRDCWVGKKNDDR